MGGEREGILEDLLEHRCQILFEDFPVAGVRDQDIPEPAYALVPELLVIHVEVPSVVGLPRPREIVVQGSAGGYYEVHHPLFHHIDYNAAGAGCHYACGEGEHLEASLFPDHLLGYVNRISQLGGRESSRPAHGLYHLVDRHAFPDLYVLDLQQILHYERLLLSFLRYRRPS